MIGHAVGQAVGQGGRSRRSVGQRFMTGYDRPMTDHDRPLPSLIIIDGLFNLIFNELNEGKNSKMIKQHILNYINNYKIISQEIYNWLLNNQNDSNSIYLLGYFNFCGIG